MDVSDHVIVSHDFDPSTEPRLLLDRLAKRDYALVAVSAGQEPLLAAFEGERVSLKVPGVESIDTLGAGDVLHGAYAYFLASGLPIRTSLERAVAVASRSCERHGPRAARRLSNSEVV